MKKLLYSLFFIFMASSILWSQPIKKHIPTVPPSLKDVFHPHLHQKQAHDRCGFVNSNRFNSPERKAWLAQWEKALQSKMAERKRNRTQGTEETVYVVPVIVHVIHNGEPVGEGANISAEQVYSQIEVINEDFRALNEDLSDTRSQYVVLAGDTKVTFAPALEDPDGNLLEEPGIQRYNGGRASWDISSFDNEAKPATQFDPYRYANFWTASLSGGLLGYAQFPLDPVVPGIPSGNPDTEISDGVVMGYQYFGSIDKVNTPQLQDGAPFNLGRTATHEVGHWLGLFHIWGDGDCSADDQVADTPNQGSPSSGCPDPSTSTCGELDMWENFMDYSNDDCMSLFTQGQVDRMRTVLELDDMRQQLMNSNVPVLGNNTFNSSATQACVNTEIEFRATLAPDFNIVSWEFEGGTPNTSTDTQVSVSYSNVGVYDVKLTVRGGDNDTTIVVNRPNYIRILDLENSQVGPVASGFEEGLPATWESAPGGWVASNVGLNSGGSMTIDHFNNEFGEVQELFLPIVDLRNATDGATFRFDLAYPEGNNSTDDLAVGYIDPCSGSYTELWRATGSELSTAPATDVQFVPSSSDDWAAVTIRVLDVSTIDYAQFVFKSTGNNGNAIYIDNVELAEAKGAVPSFNLLPGNIVCPGFPVSFQNTTTFFGNPSGISWNWTFEGGIPSSSTEENPSDISFANPGEYDITLSATIGGEVYSITFENAVEVLNLDEQPVSILETLDAPTAEILENPLWAFEGPWAYAPPPLGLAVDNYNNDYTGVEVVASTPAVSFQGNENALLSFDIAYAGFGFQGNEVYDDIMILYSTDCGESFTTLATVSGADLANTEPISGPFVPSSSSDWKEVVYPLYEINNDGDLSSIRFAIQVLGRYGNIMWFDNIHVETFPSAPPIADFYAVPYPQPEDEGSVFKETVVEFADESRLNPQFWTWSFEGGVPAVSNERNPKVIYDKPGVYNVSLTVSNAFGTGTKTKSSYLVVNEVEGGTDITLGNTIGNEVVNVVDSGFGYISGNNSFGDMEVAEYFTDPSPFTNITQIDIGFLEATPNIDGNGESTVTVNIWSEEGGAPAAIIETLTIPFADAVASASTGELATISLPDGISVQGNFFIGVEVPYNGEDTGNGYSGDNLAIRTDEVENNTAWTLFSDESTWEPFNSGDNWGAATSRALWIFPTLATETVTGLNNSRLSESIQVYPNPSQGVFKINTPTLKVSTYQAIDMLGKVVKSGNLLDQQIDLSDMPDGMYFLKLQTNKGTALKKVVIR